MERYEGSQSVATARQVLNGMTWVFFIGGLIWLFLAAQEYKLPIDYIIYGISCFICGTLSYVVTMVLKGVEHIAKASEMYMEELRKKNENEKSKKVEEKLNYLIND